VDFQEDLLAPGLVDLVVVEVGLVAEAAVAVDLEQEYLVVVVVGRLVVRKTPEELEEEYSVHHQTVEDLAVVVDTRLLECQRVLDLDLPFDRTLSGTWLLERPLAT